MFAKFYLCLCMSLLALPAWGQSRPVKVEPGAIQVFKDWVVGCDNTLVCEAISLMPESSTAESNDEVRIRRTPGAGGAVDIKLTFESSSKATASIAVDGRVFATITPSEDASVDEPAAWELARAIAQGRTLEVKQGKRVIAQPSLSGASAALRYMDAMQNRAGTITALVASGPKPASTVPPPRAVPTIVRARVTSTAEPVPLTRAEKTQAAKVSGCEEEEDSSESFEEISLYSLDTERALALIPCGRGAYNFNSVVLIVRGKPGSRLLSLASFDDEPSPSDPDWLPFITNASWDPATTSIESYTKGRGLGDCGVAQTYTWDGNRMRLTSELAMSECRGSRSMITTWRADIK